ncbi:MAG: hypothetical protein Q7S80_03070 [bacterium]|nr:hypothetical protein [bacterium]
MRNLFFLFTITTFAVASTVLSIFNYNPYQSSPVTIINFYASFLISLAGIGAIIIYYAKIKLAKNETIYSFFWSSVRQALFGATAITIVVYLQSLRILDWLIGISVVIVSILLELFFESKRRP